MEKEIREPEVLVTMQDHFELLASIVGMSSEVLECGDDKLQLLEKELVGMISEVTSSLKKRCHFVVKQSARFHRKPSIWRRLKERRVERREAKELKRLQDAEYREFLAQKRAKEDIDDDDDTEEQSQGEDVSLPALRKDCAVDILDAEDSEENIS